MPLPVDDELGGVIPPAEMQTLVMAAVLEQSPFNWDDIQRIISAYDDHLLAQAMWELVFLGKVGLFWSEEDNAVLFRQLDPAEVDRRAEILGRIQRGEPNFDPRRN